MPDGSRFIDITLPFSDRLAVWPGDPPVTIIRSTGVSTISELRLSSHAGTHVDAPAHFFPRGMTVDQLPLDLLVGPAWLVKCRGAAVITATHLDDCRLPPGVERLLLQTDNSAAMTSGGHAGPGSDAFDQAYVSLDSTASAWLLARRIRLVGIDGPSVDPYSSPDFPVHQALLANNVAVVENLALAGVEPGPYRLIVLPLPYVGGDGAPARAILEQPLEQKE